MYSGISTTSMKERHLLHLSIYNGQIIIDGKFIAS